MPTFDYNFSMVKSEMLRCKLQAVRWGVIVFRGTSGRFSSRFFLLVQSCPFTVITRWEPVEPVQGFDSWIGGRGHHVGVYIKIMFGSLKRRHGSPLRRRVVRKRRGKWIVYYGRIFGKSSAVVNYVLILCCRLQSVNSSVCFAFTAGAYAVVGAFPDIGVVIVPQVTVFKDGGLIVRRHGTMVTYGHTACFGFHDCCVRHWNGVLVVSSSPSLSFSTRIG